MRIQRAQVFLDRLDRSPGSARRAIQAGADDAPDSQRSVIDPDRLADQRKRAASRNTWAPLDREIEIEAGAEAEIVERARLRRRGPAAQGQVEPGSGGDVGQRHRSSDHRFDPRRIAAADSGALEHPPEAVALAERGDELNGRAFGRVGERDHRRGRTHPASAIAAQRQRHDHLAAEFVAHPALDPHRRGGLDRIEAGPEQQRDGGEPDHRRHPAQPATAADVERQIGHPIDVAQRGQVIVAQFVSKLAPVFMATAAQFQGCWFSRNRVGKRQRGGRGMGGRERFARAEAACQLFARFEQPAPLFVGQRRRPACRTTPCCRFPIQSRVAVRPQG